MLRGASSACAQSICTGTEVDGKAINQPAERRHGAGRVCGQGGCVVPVQSYSYWSIKLAKGILKFFNFHIFQLYTSHLINF